MEYAVYFEEEVKHRHRVILECEDESDLEDILDDTDYSPDFDSVLYKLENNDAHIIDIERDYDIDCDCCEYYDSHEYDDEEEDNNE